MLAGRRDGRGPCECLTWRCLTAFLGALTGVLGVGGGFLIVPALIFTAGVGTKQAIGSSLAIISLNSAAGLLSQLRYTNIDWRLTALFLVASLIGMGFGLAIVRRVSAQRIQLTFGCALLVIGGFIAYRNL